MTHTDELPDEKAVPEPSVVVPRVLVFFDYA